MEGRTLLAHPLPSISARNYRAKDIRSVSSDPPASASVGEQSPVEPSDSIHLTPGHESVRKTSPAKSGPTAAMNGASGVKGRVRAVSLNGVAVANYADVTTAIGGRKALSVAAFLEQLPMVDGRLRAGVFKNEIESLSNERYVRPELYLGRQNLLQTNYPHLKSRLIDLANATRHLLPGDQAENLLRVDQMCTTLLTPKRPEAYDPELPLPIEGLGERPVRLAVADSLKNFLNKIDPNVFAESVADLSGFGQRFAPQVRVPYYSEIAKLIMAHVQDKERYSYILDLFVEAQKLPLPAALQLKSVLRPHIMATNPEFRCVNRILEKEVMHRLQLNEPLPQIVTLPKLLETIQDAKVETLDEIERLANSVQQSISADAHQYDLQNLRKAFVFAVQAPINIRQLVINHVIDIAKRCEYKLSSDEINNALSSVPKIDNAKLEVIERQEHAFIRRLQTDPKWFAAQAGDRHRYGAAARTANA